MTDTATAFPLLLTDGPEHPANDALGFQPHADRLAAMLLKQQFPDASFVVGIEGEWGEGKSTFINCLKQRFAALKQDQGEILPDVVEFNPWWFDNPEKTASNLLEAIINGRHQSNEDVIKALESLLAGLNHISPSLEKLASSPLVITGLFGINAIFADKNAVWIGASVAACAAFLLHIGLQRLASQRAGAESLSGLKQKAVAALKSEKMRGQKQIVIIDDLDRLSHQEIREVFRAVKGVLDLPNIIYIIAYDRAIVASALDEVHKGRGEAYLEKIVQLPYRLPKPTEEKLESYNKNALFGSGAVSAVVPDPFEAEASFRYISQAFLKLPRDVKRLQASMCTFALVPESIRMDPLDFMFLEALRMKQRVLWLALTQAVLDADGYVTVAEGATDREAARLDWLRAKMPTLEKAEDQITAAVRFFTGWTLSGDGRVCRAQTTQRLSWLSKPLQNVTDSYTWLDEVAVLQSMVHAYLQLQQEEGQYSNQQIEKFLLATSAREYEAALPPPPHGRFLYEAAGYLEHQTPAGFVLERHLTAMAASLEQEFQSNGHPFPGQLSRLLLRYFSVERATRRDLSSEGVKLLISWLPRDAPMLVTQLLFSYEPLFQPLKPFVIRHYLEGELGELLALPIPSLVLDVLFALVEGEEGLRAAWVASLPTELAEADTQLLSALFSSPGGQEKLAHSWLTSCQPFVDLVRQLPRPESGPAPWAAFLQKATV